MGLLKTAIIESKTIETEFPGFDGLTLSLAHLTRDELKSIRKKATTTKFSKKTRQQEEETDNDLFQELWVKAVIVGWAGFKYSYLEEMLPIDLSSLTDEQYKKGEGFFPYNKDDAVELMLNATAFESWISTEIEDIGNFTKNS